MLEYKIVNASSESSLRDLTGELSVLVSSYLAHGWKPQGVVVILQPSTRG